MSKQSVFCTLTIKIKHGFGYAILIIENGASGGDFVGPGADLFVGSQKTF